MGYDGIKARGLSSMVEVHVQTLVVSTAPAPCVLVLQPLLEKPTETDDHVSSRIIPIWVGVAEATQLGVALENAKFARPMTHDLMLDALTNLDTRVDHVLISDVRGSMFFARLILRHHDRLIARMPRFTSKIRCLIAQAIRLSTVSAPTVRPNSKNSNPSCKRSSPKISNSSIPCFT